MIFLPPHSCRSEDGIPFGELDNENRAICTVIRTWDLRGRPVDRVGCGSILSLCHHGIRGHCGAIERPAIGERKAA